MAILETDVARATRTRILDAAFDAVADFGLSRLTMEDVATRATCSRQTLYRYFPTRDDLLAALVLREEERFLEGVRAAFAAAVDLEEGVREAVVFVLGEARRHPLLDRLLRTEPDALLPYLTTRGRAAVDRAASVLRDLLSQRAGETDRETLRQAADAAVRLLISYTINPPSDRPERVAAALARILASSLDPGSVRSAEKEAS